MVPMGTDLLQVVLPLDSHWLVQTFSVAFTEYTLVVTININKCSMMSRHKII